jgi:tRNA(fMet)-specific endonuclease VapC
MELIFDTSILIAVERGKISRDILDRSESIYISTITIMEVLTGLNRRHMEGRREKSRSFIEKAIESFCVLPFCQAEARICANLKDQLTDNGITIGAEDLMIASTAIVASYPLMTLNKSDFIRIPGLEVL